ncbi:MAG: hypothetical protein F6K41_19810 [Symploca sp. SIO3E6]|nr:hypothetical protein [Caldora sp. SIO3E6]
MNSTLAKALNFRSLCQLPDEKEETFVKYFSLIPSNPPASCLLPPASCLVS